MEAASSDPPAPQPAASANHSGVAAGMGIEAAFDAGSAHSVGIEDEVMLLDPDTLELVARGPKVLDRLDGDERFQARAAGVAAGDRDAAARAGRRTGAGSL